MANSQGYAVSRHTEAVAKARALFLEELASTEGWEDQGEREGGVHLYNKPDAEDPYGVPTVKGECIVENCTAAEFQAVIQLPGMRYRWDPRFEEGHMLVRYSRSSYAFYTEMKGMGWLVYPRDIVGVQKNYHSSELDGEIVVIQTSVDEPDLAPVRSGKARATLTVSGWHLLPQGNDLKDLKVTYIVKISLGGSIPLALVNMVATETPMCTGRAKAVYETLGHAPFVHFLPTDCEETLTFVVESFSPPTSVTDPGPLQYECQFVPGEGGKFHLLYDAKKMYQGGIVVQVDGAGVRATDDGVGGVQVVCQQEGEWSGEAVTVKIGPK